MAYEGNYIADLDETTPDGTVEKSHVLDNAIREVKRALKNMELDHINGIPAVASNPGVYLRIKTDGSGFEVYDVDQDIADLESGKAEVVHSHTSDYAPISHTHGSAGIIMTVVPTATSYPTGTTVGEIRITADDLKAHIWTGTRWQLKDHTTNIMTWM